VDVSKLSKPKKQASVRQAILGGGDIVFPLIFSGAVFTQLLQQGLSHAVALFSALTVSMATLISLYLLFLLGKKNKFYPAMPFVSIGCFVGYFMVKLIILFF
jgi:presenilin-like A22 family membrane protease